MSAFGQAGPLSSRSSTKTSFLRIDPAGNLRRRGRLTWRSMDRPGAPARADRLGLGTVAGDGAVGVATVVGGDSQFPRQQTSPRACRQGREQRRPNRGCRYFGRADAFNPNQQWEDSHQGGHTISCPQRAQKKFFPGAVQPNVRYLLILLWKMVGVAGFEPTTPSPPD